MMLRVELFQPCDHDQGPGQGKGEHGSVETEAQLSQEVLL